MAGLKFGTFSQAARVSNLDIDTDLDMGVLSVIAAKGQFTEAYLDKTVVTDTLITPYTVVPSENVYFTADFSTKPWLYTTYTPLALSIKIGPTSIPISPRLYFNISSGVGGSNNTRLQLRVHKNDEVIATTEEINTTGDHSIDLSDLMGGDILSFSARASRDTPYIGIENFRLAGDVVTHLIDTPTAERVQ